MVGGRVIETLDTGDRVWVNCRERDSTTAIYLERTFEARSISPGDIIWWQGKYAFWTPKVGGFHDRRLTRIGGSGVHRPAVVVRG